ncbi:hypothetical protein [Streptomyces sp. NBC_01244]|uniref:hypothetical protein n=1 Tax=Streptomyces sp. NBC_01244 TaxID=2903797 RepID=UPI002E1438DF|nr:hypothetical protein OG247_17850 [Streptomyces sp. NBC_01244]
MSAIERAPAPVNKFDRYPAVEWAAQGRPEVGGNVWSSVSIANVTGLTFDRVECKFITDFMLKGKREAEVRLAAFRHDGNANRTIVSASRVLNLHGATERYVGVGLMRWVHGIPFGWDYEENNTTYTIELQHRYRVGPESYDSDAHTTDVFAFYKPTDKAAPSTGGALQIPGTSWDTMVLPQSRPNVSGGWVTIPRIVGDQEQYGSYSISAMQYCVGLPKERIPEASAAGWAWTRNLESSWGRAADITEPHFGV